MKSPYFLKPDFSFKRVAIVSFLLGVALLPGTVLATPPPSPAELAAGFAEPPMAARPMTWWHWIDGNITKEGITKDLEWMKQFGLGGAVVFNVGMLPDSLPRKVKFETDEWWAMVDHAITEADRLGLKIGFHNCDGWSHSGGPWMTPEQSMKKLVWTESFVRGGEQGIVIAQPETIRDFYRDVAVLAMPVQETTAAVRWDQLTSNLPEFDAAALQDGNFKTHVALGRDKAGQPVHFDFRFDQPRTIGAVTLTLASDRIGPLQVALAISDDGTVFRTVETTDLASRGTLGWRTRGAGGTLSLSFPAQPARAFRLTFVRGGGLDIAEVTLHATERVDRWEIKAGHVHNTEHGGAAEKYATDPARYTAADPAGVIARAAIVDLTAKLGADNRLAWTAPPGNWRIVRVGYTSSGKTNGPSTVEGRGLEADKLDPAALDTHYAGFMKKLADREVNRHTSSLAYGEIDSWEAGVQNWTGKMGDVFKELNGYDLKPYLPVLVGGYVVESYEKSERFLWDFRKTVAYLIRNGVFKHLVGLMGQDRLTAFAEGAGRQQYLYDPINYQSAAAIPKGEFWVGRDGGANLNATSALPMKPRIDCKVAASVAHLYGGQLAASESFTGGGMTWEMGPGDNKMVGDQAFTMGINTMVLHTSAHQPYDHLKPGFSLGGAGSHFHRNNIVYAASNAWPHYLARCQYLLRQGVFAADVLHFTGENVPNYLGFRDELPVPLPEGYDYDGCNAEILLEHARVEDGTIVLDSGMRYRVLLLSNETTMSLPLLRRVQALVRAGATVVGPRPQGAPGLRDYPRQGEQVRQITAEVWGDCDGVAVKEHRYGQGRVMWGRSFPEIFAALNVTPDFIYETANPGLPINYIHRRVGETEIYFVASTRAEAATITARFRVSGKVPQLYLPDTGEIIPTAGYAVHDGFVEVPLALDPAGSVFVVFAPGEARRSVAAVTGGAVPQLTYRADGAVSAEFFAPGTYQVTFSDGTHQIVPVTLPADMALGNEWELRFPLAGNRGEKVVQSPLLSWSQSADDDIRYFSGTVVYAKTFELPADYRAADQKWYLDLGRVQKVARVRVNGQPCPDLWKVPFRTEVTGRLKPGTNRIELEVTNTWTNRMIGDAQLPLDLSYTRYLTALPDWLDGAKPRASARQTFTLQQFYDQGDALLPSGLLGPVAIKVSRVVTLAVHP